MKILVVDDSRIMRTLVRRALRQAGFGNHEVVEACDGKEALVVFDNESPDLVLSDWNMPEMTGIEFLAKLREDGARVPFVFITTEGTPEMRGQASAIGASGFLVKPFSDADVSAALDQYLG